MNFINENEIDEQIYQLEKTYNYFELMELQEIDSDLDKLKRDANSFNSLAQRLLFDFSSVVIIYFATFFIGDLINGFFTGRWTKLSRSIWGPTAYLDDAAVIKWLVGKIGIDPNASCEEQYEERLNNCHKIGLVGPFVNSCKDEAEMEYNRCVKQQENGFDQDERQCEKNANERYNNCMRIQGGNLAGAAVCALTYETNLSTCESGGTVDSPYNPNPQLRQCQNQAQDNFDSCMIENQNDSIGQYECQVFYDNDMEDCDIHYGTPTTANSSRLTPKKTSNKKSRKKGLY
mgnify:CR=1 FL=1